MTYELGRALLLTETVDSTALGDALLVASQQHLPLVRALASVDGSMAKSAQMAVAAELANATSDVEMSPLAAPDLLARLPAELCHRLGVLPLRMVDGIVYAAAADVRDRHAAEELAYWLQEEVQLVHAPLEAIERALAPKPPLEASVESVPAPETRAYVPLAAHAAPPIVPQIVPAVSLAPSMPPTLAARVDPMMPSPSAPPPPSARPIAPAFAPSSPPPASRRDVPQAPHVPHAPHLSSRPPAPVTTRSETPPWGTPVRRSVRPASLGTSSHSQAPMPRPSERPIKSDLPPSASMAVASVAPPRFGSAPPDPYVAQTAPRFSSRPPQTPPLPLLSNMIPTAARTMRDFSGALTSGPPRPEDALEAVATAEDRDQLVAALLVAARAVADRVAIFAVRRDVFSGWTCSPELAEPTAFRALTVPLGAPSVLALATVAGSYFGPVTRNEAHAPLLALMGTASRDVAVVAVRAAGRAALIVLADDLHDSMIGTRHLEKLASIAGTSLGRLVRA